MTIESFWVVPVIFDLNTVCGNLCAAVPHAAPHVSWCRSLMSLPVGLIEHLLVHGDAGQLGKTCRPDVGVGSPHPVNLDKACMFGPKGVLSKKTIHYS